MTSARVDGRTLRYRHRRPELLAAATDFVLEHGVLSLSLRSMATALGVTHATLLRHFGSKQQLILLVLKQIYADVSAEMDRVAERAGTSSLELMTAVWDRLCEPVQQRQFVLLFELVGQTLREHSGTRELAQTIVGDWEEDLRRRLAADGVSAVCATAIVATARGLQLDLLLSGDKARVDRAFVLAVRGILAADDSTDGGRARLGGSGGDQDSPDPAQYSSRTS